MLRHSHPRVVMKGSMTSKPASSEAEAIRDRMMRGERFSSREVEQWTHSPDIEVRGAAFQALTSTTPVVDGPLDERTMEEFIVRYLIARMETEQQFPSMFELPPYLAANTLASWYRQIRDQRASGDHASLRQARGELKRLYATGSEKQRRCVVDGALEHIFESPSCRRDFDDWSEDPQLLDALREADEWANDQQPDPE